MCDVTLVSDVLGWLFNDKRKLCGDSVLYL